MSYKQFNILWSNKCKKTEYKSISISDKYVIISHCFIHCLILSVNPFLVYVCTFFVVVVSPCR